VFETPPEVTITPLAAEIPENKPKEVLAEALTTGCKGFVVFKELILFLD